MATGVIAKWRFCAIYLTKINHVQGAFLRDFAAWIVDVRPRVPGIPVTRGAIHDAAGTGCAQSWLRPHCRRLHASPKGRIPQ